MNHCYLGIGFLQLIVWWLGGGQTVKTCLFCSGGFRKMSAAKSRSLNSHRAQCARDQQRQQRQTPHQCRSSNKASNIKKCGILGPSQCVYFQSTLVFLAQTATEVFARGRSHETWWLIILSLSSFLFVFLCLTLVFNPVQRPESHCVNLKT